MTLRELDRALSEKLGIDPENIREREVLLIPYSHCHDLSSSPEGMFKLRAALNLRGYNVSTHSYSHFQWTTCDVSRDGKYWISGQKWAPLALAIAAAEALGIAVGEIE